MLHMMRDEVAEVARRHGEIQRECEIVLQALDRAGLLGHGAEGCRITGWAMRGETVVLAYRDSEGDDGEQEVPGAVLFMSDRGREAWLESQVGRLGQAGIERMAREAMAQRDDRIERERATLRRLLEKHPDVLAN